MKKDVIFLIIDSLCEKNIGVGFSGKSTTPFLDSITEECFTCDKVYSQGPYTEAGTKALLCGEDTLSNGGYLLRYANANSFITNEFFDNGYETFCYMYPSALLSEETIKKTNHMIYTSGFEFMVIWKQKMSFYLQRYKNGVLDDIDIEKCVEVMRLVFFAWDKFLNPENKEEAYRLIRDCMEDYNLKKNRELLRKQIKDFEEDPCKYIVTLFEYEQKHPLFLIETVEMSKMIRNSIIENAFNCVPNIERKYKKTQLSRNIKNNRYSILKQCGDICKFIKSGNKYDLGKTFNYYKLLLESRNMTICKKQNHYKLLRSTKTILDDLANVMTVETSKPKFVFVHTEDTHYFSTFFSYDSSNSEVISSELRDAEEYIDNVGENYKGNLMYDLSIRYVDKQLKVFFEKLKRTNKLEMLTMCITADHGYSYNRYPLRKRLVNNFFEENYSIPLWIYDKCGKHEKYPYYMLSKDLLATLYDWCGLQISSSVTGQSVLGGGKIRDYIITEYMGPGCPDLRNREVWMSARNAKRMVAIKASLNKENLEMSDVVEVYNLTSDPLEERALKELDDESKMLFEVLDVRWNRIKEENR